MSTAKTIAGIIPGLQATALLAQSIKLAKVPSVKKITPKKIVKVGVGTLIGISMIKPTSQMINVL